MSEPTARPQRRGSGRALTRRAVALVAAVMLITPAMLVTLAMPAGASSVPGVPGTPVAFGLQGAAALRWSAPADVGSPPLTSYRVEADDGSGWSAVAVHHATALVTGDLHTCALLDNGTVKCWGSNSVGQLGVGNNADRGGSPGDMANLPAVDLGTGRIAVALVASGYHTCALLDNGTVKCWGYNLYGELGLGDTESRGDNAFEMGNNLPAVDLGTDGFGNDRTAVALAAGIAHTCALLDDGTVKCWGLNNIGELGLGDTDLRGDNPGEMGDNLPAVDLGTGRTAVAITASYFHTCAVLDDREVKCWGDNSVGELGLGDSTNRGDSPGQMGDNLPAVDLGTGHSADAITAGYFHTCAVLEDATVKCWGYNAYGQLGLGDTTTRGDGPGQMGNNLHTVDLGTDGFETPHTANALTAGGHHTCALLDDHEVKCWGYNAYGQLGLGDTTARGVDPSEMGDNLLPVDLGTGRTADAISAGGGYAGRYHTCARLDNSTLKCWGSNDNGQLGQGDTTNRGDGIGPMGDNLLPVDLGAGRTAAPATSAIARLAPATYDFRVVALNSEGESTPSDASGPVDVTSGPLSAPTDVAGTPGNGEVALTWSAPWSDGGSAISDYQVSVFSDSGGTPTGVTGTTVRLVGSATTSYAFTGLTNKTGYTFTVAAVNDTGTGPESQPSAVVAPATLTVPAQIPNPGTDGYDTGVTVDNSVTFSASGTWCNIYFECEGPDGDPNYGDADSTFLLEGVTAFTLLGRIGSSGPWTPIGSGPSTLNGTGELFLVMNDKVDAFDDNSGALSVTIDAALNLSTYYDAGGPVLATGTTGWHGLVTNNGDTTLTNVTVAASAGLELTAAQTSVPTWSYYDGESSFPSTPCTRAVAGSSKYSCAVPSLSPAQSVIVDANVLPQGVQPQKTVHDLFGIAASDQTVGCALSQSQCPGDAPFAPQAQLTVDGLQFNITAPATVNAGDPLTITGSLTNTSATQAITGITTFSTLDRGSITSAGSCAFTNKSPTGSGASTRCLATGTFDVPASSTSAPTDFVIDTTNLAGKTIHYATFATSPDLGGSTYVASGSVFVAAPAGSVVISTPANNATLGRSLANEFTAVPSPSGGHNVTSVDLQNGNGALFNVAAPGPYTRTFAPNALTPGAHTLKAIMHQDGGVPDVTTSITVQVAAAPTVSIVSPNFSPGSSLDTGKTFTATVSPGTPATIKSVAWQIDPDPSNPIIVPSLPVPSSSVAPYTATVSPATLVLPAGVYTLSATATDSVFQTKQATFSFTVPEAALDIPTVTRLADSITPGGDAAWSVEVDNSSGAIARHVTLTLNAVATDATTTTTALTFDTPAINGTLHRPPSTPTCVPGVGTSLICNLPDIGANSGVQFPIFVDTDGLTGGSTITADAPASAANAPATAPQSLGAVDVIDCGEACVVGVAAAGTSFGSSPDHTNPTEQIVMLSKGLTSIAHGVPYGQTFRLASPSTVKWGRVTFRPRIDLAPAPVITLNSIDPTNTNDAAVQNACPTATPCQGLVSQVGGSFGAFANKADPIVVVIIQRWGITAPTGSMWIQKPADAVTGQFPQPFPLQACAVDPTTRLFNTPCTLPQILRSLTVNGTTTYTTYNTVLFTGDDPYYFRR